MTSTTRGIFEPAGDGRPERGAQHARAARDRFRLKGWIATAAPTLSTATADGVGAIRKISRRIEQQDQMRRRVSGVERADDGGIVQRASGSFALELPSLRHRCPREISCARLCPLRSRRPKRLDKSRVAFAPFGLCRRLRGVRQRWRAVSQKRTNSARASFEIVTCRSSRSTCRVRRSSRRAKCRLHPFGTIRRR